MTIRRISNTNLFIGNVNDARDIDNLRNLEIRDVVNVAKDVEGPWFHGDFRNYKVPLLDGAGNEVYHYIMAAEIVLTLLDKNLKVLLHCAGGISRSPAIATICLVCMNKANSLDEAFMIVKDSRSSSDIRPEHWSFMEETLSILNS
jgi:protein-tyrosine phosphatase